MKLVIDQAAVQAAVQEQTERAVADVIGGYEFKQTINKAMASGALASVITESVTAAANSMDTQAMTRALATEIQRAVTSAIVLVIEDAMATIIMKLRGINEYGDAEKTKRAAVLAELRSLRRE